MTTDLKGRVNQVWIAVGLICAIAAFGLAYYFTRASSTPPKPTVPANGQLVVVARVAIPSGTLITPGMLEVTRIKGLVPTNAYTSCQALVGEACAASAGVTATTGTQPTTLNYYAVVPISPNTEVTQNMVSPSKVTQTPSFGNLNLPPGDVAIAIPLTAQQAVAGYLQAGDRIDIIASTGSLKAGVVPKNMAAHDVGVVDPLRHQVQPGQQPHHLLVQSEQDILQPRSLLGQELLEVSEWSGLGSGGGFCGHRQRVSADRIRREWDGPESKLKRNCNGRQLVAPGPIN